jgi:23S rRNA (pseudouridine1915-N3)-methyltransferase
VKVWLISVGRPGRLLQPAMAEYETRARRYWSLELVEVREERARKGLSDDQVRDAETERILKRVPKAAALVVLTRTGTAWSSAEFARQLAEHALHGGDVAFVIGGALGLGDGILAQSPQRLSLSGLTMPHDIARLVLLEQLYRAGTIVRGEPYHKGSDEA